MSIDHGVEKQFTNRAMVYGSSAWQFFRGGMWTGHRWKIGESMPQDAAFYWNMFGDPQYPGVSTLSTNGTNPVDNYYTSGERVDIISPLDADFEETRDRRGDPQWRYRYIPLSRANVTRAVVLGQLLLRLGFTYYHWFDWPHGDFVNKDNFRVKDPTNIKTPEDWPEAGWEINESLLTERYENWPKHPGSLYDWHYDAYNGWYLKDNVVFRIRYGWYGLWHYCPPATYYTTIVGDDDEIIQVPHSTGTLNYLTDYTEYCNIAHGYMSVTDAGILRPVALSTGYVDSAGQEADYLYPPKYDYGSYFTTDNVSHRTAGGVNLMGDLKASTVMGVVGDTEYPAGNPDAGTGQWLRIVGSGKIRTVGPITIWGPNQWIYVNGDWTIWQLGADRLYITSSEGLFNAIGHEASLPFIVTAQSYDQTRSALISKVDKLSGIAVPALYRPPDSSNDKYKAVWFDDLYACGFAGDLRTSGEKSIFHAYDVFELEGFRFMILFPMLRHPYHQANGNAIADEYAISDYAYPSTYAYDPTQNYNDAEALQWWLCLKLDDGDPENKPGDSKEGV